MKWTGKIMPFCAICAGVLLVACGDTKQSGNRVIEIGAALAHPVELAVADYFSKIRYIPLETTDSCLIGKAPDVRIVGDQIMITTALKQCLLFDKATGRFLRQIGHVGNDPGGYKDVNCIVDEEGSRLLFHGWGHDLIGYDTNGNYLGKVEVPAITETPLTDYFCLNTDTLLGYFPNMDGSERKRILYFREDGEQLAVLPNEQSCPTFEIASISVWMGEKAVEMLGPPALRGVLFLVGKDPETNNISYMDNSPFWRLGGDTYFKELFNDTIYKVKGTTLVPELFFNADELSWSYQDRFQVDKSKNIFISRVLDSDNKLFFFLTTDVYTDKRQNYNAVFDKETGDVRVSSYEKGLTDNLTNFLPVQPSSVSSSGEYVSLLKYDQIVEWFDKHPGAACPEALEHLRHTDEEQNPVVVLLSE